MSARKHYPLSVSLLHWLLALAILGNLVLGWLLDDEPALMALHKSIGALILLLALARLLNKLRSRKRLPSSVNAAGTVSYLGEKAVHGLLYLGMFSVPLLGWLKSNAAGHAVSLFGLVNLPTLIGRNADWSETLDDAHGAAAYGLAALVAAHVCAAIAHQLLRRENVVGRILPLLRR
ncbi:cytochrome b [Chromobacterium alticapitis]|uniref:Cytochrome B n=1 Tax=Chromobacterium alticapitis TaxID=2073169 RepID=A0A2S5DAQ7_9NEIS|nr:cytochrome b/b6 domain-containing protein [Chromobacterium alticapitis]POZ60190.1 cytochrome B [Chromobacterium alticapitis]